MTYEKWEDPAWIQENVLPAHHTFTNQKTMSLNGTWKFKCFLSADDIPADVWETPSDIAQWDDIDVPCCWENRGYGRPYYYGAGLPPALSKNKRKIPQINHKKTCAGAYQRTFTVSSDWISEQVILRFDSVKSAFYCRLNDTYVGMGKGSMLPVEFDVTHLIRPGENTLSVQVYQFSDATYLEDQDMWFLSGIYRDVTLYTRPRIHIEDIYAHASFQNNYTDADLSVDVRLSQTIPANASVTAELIYDNQTVASAQIPVISPVSDASSDSFTSSVSLTVSCPGVHLWSAEIPHLYQLKVCLLADGQALDAQILDYGFREISIDREQTRLLINGRPLKLRGINYHAFTPDHGYYVPPEVYERDLKLMKQFNINAIRTSHYPQDDRFYALCNKYGLYVMDECNLETHAVRSKNVPGDNPVWTAHVTDRMQRMVLRDRNHPCVVIWSLGNESDIGQNHYRMKEAALKLDSSRPIHYEGGSDLNISDFLCDGYSSPEREQLFAEGRDVEKKPGIIQMLTPLNMSLDSIKFEDYQHHPILATEYNYCMGNSSCDVEKHAQIFDTSDRWCGGFVWDFKDKSITKEFVNQKPFQAYGGDYGLGDQSGSVCCDGAVNWNGVPHSVFYEIRKAFQPVTFLLEQKKTLTLFNRNSFLDLSAYNCRWILEHNGHPIEQGTLKISGSPRSHVSLPVPYTNSMEEPGSYYLSVFITAKEHAVWADDADHVIAYDQWLLQETFAPVVNIPSAGIKVVPQKDTICLNSSNVSWILSRKTGDITQILSDKKTLLKAPLRPAFYRAVTDADAGFMGLAMGKMNKIDAWGKVTFQGMGTPSSITVDNDRIVVVQRYKDNLCTRTYRITESGLEITLTLRTGKRPPVRIGMQAELDASYDTLTWYGRGPKDTYVGRQYSGLVGIHQSSVLEQDEYVRPQEHGNKQDVRWMTLTDTSGHGLKAVSCQKTFAGGAWPYTLLQLQQARHIHELPEHTATTLNIDLMQNGLGDCFVPCPKQYKIQPETEYSYQYILSVL